VLNWLELIYQRWLARPSATGSLLILAISRSRLRAWPPAGRPARQRCPAGSASRCPDRQFLHASRPGWRNDQFNAAQRSQVAARLGWAAEALGYLP